MKLNNRGKVTQQKNLSKLAHDSARALMIDVCKFVLFRNSHYYNELGYHTDSNIDIEKAKTKIEKEVFLSSFLHVMKPTEKEIYRILFFKFLKASTE